MATFDLDGVLEAVEEWLDVKADYDRGRAEGDRSWDWSGSEYDKLQAAKKAVHVQVAALVGVAVKEAFGDLCKQLNGKRWTLTPVDEGE